MKKLSWTSAAIIIGMPTLLSFVAWLILILSNPSKWCGSPLGAAITTGQKLPINDCTSIVRDIIHWLGWGMMALIAVVAIAFISIVVRDLRLNVDARGPGGIGVKFDTDEPPAVQIKQPADNPIPVEQQ